MNTFNQIFLKRLRSKTAFGLLLTCFLAMVVSGCFQATNKFYFDSDITTDKRFEGRFGANSTTHDTNQAQSLVIKLDQNKHYVATYKEEDHWIKLDAVLFKSGTNLFVDFCHLADNGTHEEPAVGPSGLDMLHIATSDKTHSVIRVRFVDDGVAFGFGFGNPVLMTIRKEPSLKFKNEKGHIILLDSTEKLRSFLAKVGGDDSIFQEKGRFVRVAK